MVGRICVFWSVLPAQDENSIPSSVCLSWRTHDFDRNTSSGHQLDVRWRWRFLFHALDQTTSIQVIHTYWLLSDACCSSCAAFLLCWGMALSGYRCSETIPILKGLYYLSALLLWGWSALRHLAYLPDSQGSYPARRAPNKSLLSVGYSAGISGWVVFWGWVRCNHLPITVLLPCFAPPCYLSSRRSLRLLGATCPIWFLRAAEPRCCWSLRRFLLRCLPGCSPFIQLQQAGFMPPMALSMSQWRWSGYG